MKVCLIYDFLTEFGGLEREMVNHALMLREQGHEVEVLTCHFNKEAVAKMAFRDIKITNIAKIPTKYEFVNLLLCFLGFHNINKVKTDAFLSYSFPSNYLIRNSPGKKMNYINHFPHFLYLPFRDKMEWAFGTKGIKRPFITLVTLPLVPILRWIDRKLINKLDVSWVNSKFTKLRLDNIYDKNFKVSYPPIDPIFKPSSKKIKGEYIFLSSRIIPDKKYEWLIESAALMKNKLPIYLSGQAMPSYRKKLEELAVQKNVKLVFLGRLSTEDLVSYYTNAKIFAFPTPGEDFGLVPAESLACGTPVIVWGDGAGPTEQVIDGVTGYFAKPYDFKDYAEKMDKCLELNLKKKNNKKILESSKKFSYGEIKKEFINDIDNAFNS